MNFKDGSARYMKPVGSLPDPSESLFSCIPSQVITERGVEGDGKHT